METRHRGEAKHCPPRGACAEPSGRGAPGTWGGIPCRSDSSGLPSLSLAVTRGRHFPAVPICTSASEKHRLLGSPHNTLGAFLPGKGDELAEMPTASKQECRTPSTIVGGKFLPSAAKQTAESGLQLLCVFWTQVDLASHLRLPGDPCCVSV